jgi:hypothetical protein
MHGIIHELELHGEWFGCRMALGNGGGEGSAVGANNIFNTIDNCLQIVSEVTIVIMMKIK